jgi:AraC-like DNA-binding protein
MAALRNIGYKQKYFSFSSRPQTSAMPIDKSTSSPSLPGILRDKLIPWAQDNACRRIIVAKPVMKISELPDGVQMERRKLNGKRVIFKGDRAYGNVRTSSARWPDDGLVEMKIPKLICVINGTADYQVGRYALTCSAGHFIFIPPQTPHPDGNRPHLEGSRKKEGSCDLLQIIAYRGGLQCWICQSRGEQHTGALTDNYLFLNGQVSRLFELLREELLNEKTVHVCNGLMLSFMAALQREVQAGRYMHPGLAVKAESPRPAQSEFVQQLENYVEQHLQEHLTLESVARHMYMSQSQLVRRVRKEAGKTFVEFLTMYRIKEAKTLLRESEWTAQTISQFVGFKSPDYFYTFFLRHVGCTPSEFRAKTNKT